MPLNLELIKVSGATMNSRYSKEISQYNTYTKHLLPNLDQWLGDCYVFVKEMQKELERDEIRYVKPLD